MKAVLIRPDFTVEVLDAPEAPVPEEDGGGVDLEPGWLHEKVGGYFERVHALRHVSGCLIDVWIDEDGIAKQLPLNRLASTLASRLLLGPAVVLASIPGDPCTYGVPDDVVEFITKYSESVTGAMRPFVEGTEQ